MDAVLVVAGMVTVACVASLWCLPIDVRIKMRTGYALSTPHHSVQ